MSHVTFSEKVWLTADGKATTDEAEGVRLFARPGHRIPIDKVEATGYRAGGNTPAPVSGQAVSLGAGWYLLPDGSKVRGKEAAEKAVAGPPHDKSLKPKENK